MAWLLDVVPPDYLLHGVLKRHPVALAALARHHLAACVDGARDGYRSARTELGPHLPPTAVEAVLAAYRSEGGRLAAAAKAADLVERALHGEQFVRQAGGARPATRRTDRAGQQARPAGQSEPGAPKARAKSASARDTAGTDAGATQRRERATDAESLPSQPRRPGAS